MPVFTPSYMQRSDVTCLISSCLQPPGPNDSGEKPLGVLQSRAQTRASGGLVSYFNQFVNTYPEANYILQGNSCSHSLYTHLSKEAQHIPKIAI